MVFERCRTFLLEQFAMKGFEENVRNGLTHESQLLVEYLPNGTRISVSFPGYKARITEDDVYFDYRVDICKNRLVTSLSHTNIIADIYHKVTTGNMDAEALENCLLAFSTTGKIDPQIAEKLNGYICQNPDKGLLDRIKTAHGSKHYNKAGNMFELTLRELFLSLKWIILQEDINYPMEKGFEGRKMAVNRYLEAIYAAKNSDRSIEEVIERALMHGRPKPWPELDYTLGGMVY